MNILTDKLIGTLCSDDYKGINNQYVDQGKVVICLKNINLVVGERSKSQEHCVRMKELVGGSENIVTDKQYAVRRLTPKECERLQDLPDGWTIVEHKSCSDSARYKALGNGMTQAVPDWLIKRLVYFVNKEEKQ